jgi:2-polyprenyl-3-methyl-5-hydroxy-6-metoxy-1,4-benzoquinol methylase
MRIAMDKRYELFKKENRKWDDIYLQFSLKEIPWHNQEPDVEFKKCIENERIKPKRVLDVGCGAGTDAIYLASKGCQVTAVDISEEAIRMAKERAFEAIVKVDFIADDFMKMEFEGACFDFINDRGYFHHIEPPERENFAEKINQILKDVGYYYLRCWSDKEEESKRGPYRISQDEIRATFSQYFKIGEINDFRFSGKGARGYTCMMKKASN